MGAVQDRPRKVERKPAQAGIVFAKLEWEVASCPSFHSDVQDAMRGEKKYGKNQKAQARHKSLHA